MTSGFNATQLPRFSPEEQRWFEKVAGVAFSETVNVLEYAGFPLVADARLKFTLVEGLRIESPDNYFTFREDGTRPDDILFVYTPGEHVPDWDYSRGPLLAAARRVPEGIIIDAGCGTGFKAALLSRHLEAEGLANPVLLVDPNPRAVKTTLANLSLNHLAGSRHTTLVGTLREALPQFRAKEVAGAYLNPPYQARPEHLRLAVHCDGGPDGLQITRLLLEDLLPHVSDGGVVTVHSKSPACADRFGFPVWPLLIDDLVQDRIVPESVMRSYEIRFSRTCAPMDLYDFYRLVYRERENDFARDLARRYALIDMTLVLLYRDRGRGGLMVAEDPWPANPEGVEWGVEDRKVVAPGHVAWHRLFVPRT